MSRKRKKNKARPTAQAHQPRPQMICGWCGERIRPGAESDNLYEPDAAYEHLVSGMAYVHKAHVREEDHPLYDQMPHIVFQGLPEPLEGVYEGW